MALLLQTLMSVPCPPGVTSAPTAASTSLEASSAAALRLATGWPPMVATAKVSEAESLMGSARCATSRTVSGERDRGCTTDGNVFWG